MAGECCCISSPRWLWLLLRAQETVWVVVWAPPLLRLSFPMAIEDAARERKGEKERERDVVVSCVRARRRYVTFNGRCFSPLGIGASGLGGLSSICRTSGGVLPSLINCIRSSTLSFCFSVAASAGADPLLERNWLSKSLSLAASLMAAICSSSFWKSEGSRVIVRNKIFKIK